MSTEYVDNGRVKNKTASLKTLYPAKLIHPVNLLDRGNMNITELACQAKTQGPEGSRGPLFEVTVPDGRFTIKGHKMTAKRHQMMREMQNKEKETEKAHKMITRFRTTRQTYRDANILIDMLNDYRETKPLQINTNIPMLITTQKLKMTLETCKATKMHEIPTAIPQKPQRNKRTNLSSISL